jgi:hypothetical protein
VSTKIYNGYRISGLDGGVPDPFAITSDLRDVLRAIYRAAYARQLTEMACHQIDRAEWVNRTPGDAKVQPPGSPLMAAHAAIEQATEIIEKQGKRVPPLDFQCEITFLADRLNPAGPIYALLYTEREDYREEFESIEGVEFWGYWNNTDQPDDVTDEQWDERRQVWDRILGWDPPVTRGLGWKLLGPYDGLTPYEVMDDLAAHIPSKRDRARRVAVSVVSSVEATAPAVGRVSFRDSRVVRLEREGVAAEVEPTLRDLTVDDLRGTARAR